MESRQHIGIGVAAAILIVLALGFVANNFLPAQVVSSTIVTTTSSKYVTTTVTNPMNGTQRAYEMSVDSQGLLVVRYYVVIAGNASSLEFQSNIILQSIESGLSAPGGNLSGVSISAIPASLNGSQYLDNAGYNFTVTFTIRSLSTAMNGTYVIYLPYSCAKAILIVGPPPRSVPAIFIHSCPLAIQGNIVGFSNLQIVDLPTSGTVS